MGGGVACSGTLFGGDFLRVRNPIFGDNNRATVRKGSCSNGWKGEVEGRG